VIRPRFHAHAFGAVSKKRHGPYFLWCGQMDTFGVVGSSISEERTASVFSLKMDSSCASETLVNIVTCRVERMTKWRVLVGMIGSVGTSVTCALNHTEIQRYRWFTHFPVHRCTRTRILFPLVVSWQRISAQKLALQLTMKSSSYFVCNPSGTSELQILLDSLLQLTADS
jgi:hypothetical protein